MSLNLPIKVMDPIPNTFENSIVGGALMILQGRQSMGKGESAHTLVLTVKTQKLEKLYFWKLDLNFNYKSIKFVY
jgi:hypothetical protein